MRRFDLLIGAALLFLAGFVAREAVVTRARPATARSTASFGSARADTPRSSRSEGGAREPGSPTRDVSGVPARILDVRRRLELSSHDTYIGDVIAAHDSALARWPDRATNPLRVWVQPSSHYAGFDPAVVPVVRRAFAEWSALGLPVPFTFVDSASADVRVTWVERFSEPISGKTLWAHDDDWWIIDANIQIAVRHHSGEVLDSSSVRAITMHEVGHLLGLDHTTDTTSIMAPRVRVRDLSPSDRATAQLLYRLPAGRLRSSEE